MKYEKIENEKEGNDLSYIEVSEFDIENPEFLKKVKTENFDYPIEEDGKRTSFHKGSMIHTENTQSKYL